MKRLAIVGAGDLGIQIAHHACATGQWKLAGFFDDTRQPGSQVADAQVLGGVKDVAAAHAGGAFDALIVAIGYRHLAARSRIFEQFEGRIPFATVIHPSAIVDPTCRIGPGSVIYPGCVLDMGVTIDANVVVNVGCVIAHDSHVGRGCFLSPGVRLAGFVRIAPASTLGIGTVVIDNVTVGSGIRTGAGAVVIASIADPGLYVGVPAIHKRASA
ncbi:NeuD/PglB/VioB family sugar acetyltransferase [Dyella sp.]|jgi:sugar O-acyltransferase (sialic acid O-acetyltransferase NeuD family)|uniref:NeuD/PglB/VioB family sugar acetyltransferase n=1 Tax=Dyella sp. TaxID=1869338 RepID=UPI002D78914A|nr:NeuD/PglB/VioB family sugar acetyltransferase [Dyella sp.]HET6430806.1 NeuD/PglB/VioB family sugar acetyltransferase [Dyella sp.]